MTIAKGFVFQNDDVDFDRIERLPQVARVSRDRPLAALIRTRSGEQMYGGHEASVIPLASPDGSQLRTLNRPPLVAGRLPRPGSDDEILADRKAVEILGLGVGETIPVRFIWKRLLGTPAVDFGAHPDRAEVGPLARLHIVGVHARVGSDDFSGELRLPPAVYRALGGAKLGSFQEILNVQLRSGAAGIPSFRAAVDRIAGPGDFVFSPAAADRTKVQRSIELEARALRLIAVLGALVLLMLLALALMRQAEQGAADLPTLRAFGMSRAQLVALGVARGSAGRDGRRRAGRGGGDRSLSARADRSRTGPRTAARHRRRRRRARDRRDRDPRRGPGGGRARRPPQVRTPVAHGSRQGTAGALPRAGLPPSMLAGLSLALVRRPGGPGPGPTLAGAIAAVAVAATALTFSASLDRLLTTPELYGQNWDYEAPFDPSDVPALRAGEGIPGLPPGRWLSGVAVGTGSRLDVGGRLIGVNAYDDVQGRVPPTVVEGRAPRGPSEILLARKTLDELGLEIGDSVVVRRGRRAVSMRVVGQGVVPESEWVKFGEGAALTFAGFKRVVPDAILFQVHLAVAPGAGREASLGRLERHYDWAGPARPSSIGDFDGLTGLPALVVALLGASAAAALALTLTTSVRHRRRELAILKTLGFVRGQIFATVGWQATAIAAIGLVVGVPLGVAAGRFLWNLYAEDVGVVPAAVVPVAATALIVPATLILANLIAAIPGRMAARTQPALALRAE